jgi:hypothetical protein
MLRASSTSFGCAAAEERMAPLVCRGNPLTEAKPDSSLLTARWRRMLRKSAWFLATRVALLGVAVAIPTRLGFALGWLCG